MNIKIGAIVIAEIDAEFSVIIYDVINLADS
jgi:hypothetical protein